MKLREVTLADGKFLFETKNTKSFAKYYPDTLIPKTLQDQQKEIREDARLVKKGLLNVFIIEEKKEEIGFVEIYKINKKHKRCSIGYGITEKYWGEGHATKALNLTLKKITNLGMHTVEATVIPGNTASEKVLVKNGFTKVGLMKDYYYSKGKYIDRILYWKVL